MKYSTKPKYWKYDKGYGFLLFTRKFGDKYGKKINGHWNKNINICCKDCL